MKIDYANSVNIGEKLERVLFDTWLLDCKTPAIAKKRMSVCLRILQTLGIGVMFLGAMLLAMWFALPVIWVLLPAFLAIAAFAILISMALQVSDLNHLDAAINQGAR